jgi:hypothetical protein
MPIYSRSISGISAGKLSGWPGNTAPSADDTNVGAEAAKYRTDVATLALGVTEKVAAVAATVLDGRPQLSKSYRPRPKADDAQGSGPGGLSTSWGDVPKGRSD